MTSEQGDGASAKPPKSGGWPAWANLLGLVAGVGAVVYFFFGAGSKTERKPEPAKATAASKPPKFDIRTAPIDADVTVVQFFDDYSANGINADAKYRGKVVRMMGIVAGVDKDDLGQPFIGLFGPRKQYLKAIFTKEDGLAALRQNDTVKMRCRGENIGKPELVDCVLE